MCSRGKTFLFEDHLHFVVTDPINELVLIVGVTSNSLEEEFALEKGDHEFITRKSYIYYRKAKTVSVDSIRRRLKKKPRGRTKTAQGNAKRETIKKVCEGILKSKFTSKRIKNFYKDFLVNSNLSTPK